MKRTLEGAVKTKAGMVALAGGQLLKKKEEADKAFAAEMKFLRECFLEDPAKARQMTRLRFAQEMSEDVLKRYELLGGVEPNVVYRHVRVCMMGER